MTINSKDENVVPIGIAKAKRDAQKENKISEEIAARSERTLSRMRKLSLNKGNAGKIPRSQRLLWAENVQSILQRLKEAGHSVKELFAAATTEEFRRSYDDVQAYSKTLSAMQNAKSSRQIVGYKKFLEFIELVDSLTGEGLPQLAVELTKGVVLEEGVATVDDECFELERQLKLIATRVGKNCDLIKQFSELARIREKHLNSGGECVWPDDSFSFGVGEYTPSPGITIREVGISEDDAKTKLGEPEYLDQPIGSLIVQEDDDPLLAQAKRSFRARFIEWPAARRLAKNTYYIDREMTTLGQIAFSNKVLTVSPFDDTFLTLPNHFVGLFIDNTDYWVPPSHIRGRYLIRGPAELSGDLQAAFNLPRVQTYQGQDSENSEHVDGFQFLILLYPNEKCDGLVPIVKLGGTLGTVHLVPLDAQLISMLSECVVFPKARPREFPYQTESLISYLKEVIASGELEADWEKSASVLNICPLWKVDA